MLTLPDNPVITFIAPMYHNRPMIAYSLLEQTYCNWRLLLIHDGPMDYEFKEGRDWQDRRIKFIVTKKHSGSKWGHPLRQLGLDYLAGRAMDEQLGDLVFQETTHVVISNADNYHVPGFCEYMLKPFADDRTALTYCTQFAHNHQDWRIIPVEFMLGRIDCCCVVVEKELAIEVGWRSMEEASDWTYIQDCISKIKNHNYVPVTGCLVVHN